MGVRSSKRVTSRELADELGLSEETVRHDLKVIDIEGRPGAGYDLGDLYEALQTYLELSDSHPFAAVGNADVLRGLTVTFPAENFGMKPGAYYSDRAEDIGQVVDGIEIEDIADAAESLRAAGISVAVVACSPEAVDSVLDKLAEGGVGGVLMLTPALRPRHPEGMNVTYFRIPCALKSLASAAALGQDVTPPACCGS